MLGVNIRTHFGSVVELRSEQSDRLILVRFIFIAISPSGKDSNILIRENILQFIFLASLPVI